MRKIKIKRKNRFLYEKKFIKKNYPVLLRKITVHIFKKLKIYKINNNNKIKINPNKYNPSQIFSKKTYKRKFNKNIIFFKLKKLFNSL